MDILVLSVSGLVEHKDDASLQGVHVIHIPDGIHVCKRYLEW